MIRSCSSSVKETASFSPVLLVTAIENHFSKSSQLLKTFGKRKFKSAQSYPRLFWRGVPVRRSRWLLWYCWPRTPANLLLAFFILWPSSMMMYFQSYLFSLSRSFRTKSYVVIQTFHFVVFITLRISFLVAGPPLYTTFLIVGAHLSNSDIQFEIVERGTTIRKGP